MATSFLVLTATSPPQEGLPRSQDASGDGAGWIPTSPSRLIVSWRSRWWS